MTDYERQLIAYGFSPEAAARDAYANEMVRMSNRDHPAYGAYDPDPPSQAEVREAYLQKYGLAHEAG